MIDVGNIALPGPDLPEELSPRSIVKEETVDEALYLPPKMTPRESDSDAQGDDQEPQWTMACQRCA